MDFMPSSATLLGLALKGAIVFAAAGLVTLALRRRTPAARHRTWVFALAAGLALPALVAFVPAWQVPLVSIELRMDGGQGTGNGILTPEPDVASTAPVVDGPEIGVAVAAPATTAPAVTISSSLSPVPSPLSPSPELSLTTKAFLLWLTGTILVGIALAVGVLRTRVTACAAEPLDDVEINALTRRLAGKLGITRKVQIYVGDDAMPMTWGALRPAILLPAAARDWTPAQRRDVLLHELAHIARHDYLTQIVGWLACAVHWFNPLAWLAFARLRAEQESACDDEVLALGSRPSEYAEHLIDVARSLRPMPGAAVAMARASLLASRIESVLDGRERFAARSSGGLLGAALSLLIVLPLAAAEPGARVHIAPVKRAADVPVKLAAAPVATRAAAPRPVADASPRVQAAMRSLADLARLTCDWNAPRSGRRSTASTSHSSGEGESAIRTIVLSYDDCSLDIRIRGTVRFTDDERDIASVSARGSFVIEEESGDARKRIEVRRGRGGDIERHWYVDGAEQPYGAEARTFLAEVLPSVLRRTGFEAGARVVRINAASGVQGVFREIELMSSDYVKRLYFIAMLDSLRLAPADVQRVARMAGEQLGSDYEKAQVLMAIAQRQTLDENLRAAFVQAANSIGSDYEHRRVLSAALGRARVSEAVAIALLQSVAQIGSDYEAAQLLVQFADSNGMTDRVRPSYFRAVSGISSDYERRRVLSAMLEKNRLEAPMVGDVLDAASAIGSDYEKANVLILVLNKQALPGELRERFLRAVNSVSSDHERNRVLAAYARRSL